MYSARAMTAQSAGRPLSPGQQSTASANDDGGVNSPGLGVTVRVVPSLTGGYSSIGVLAGYH